MQQGSVTAARPGTPQERPGFREFVALMAAVMAVNALSTDPMLPAFPEIAADLNVANPNDLQWMISIYFMGLGLGSLLYGPLADRFGRKPVLTICLGLFVAATAFCTIAWSFPAMLLGRFAAGFFAAGSRVIAISIVRDRFHGDAMARVMSLIFIVFMIVPILAPTFGQSMLLLAPWRGIFGALLIVDLTILIWFLTRMPETLRPENRVEITLSDIMRTLGEVITHRSSIGYMMATGLVMGALVGFITSVQPIFFDIFHERTLFPICFAGIASFMGVGSYLNSRLVETFGARRLSQSALMGMIALNLVHCLIAWAGMETMWSFIVLQAATMFCFALTGSNFGAISMEPFARGAGLASSFQAGLTTLISAGLGAVVGSHFDGTTLPLAMGFFGYGCIALIVVLWAEKGRLFTRPRRATLRAGAVQPLR